MQEAISDGPEQSSCNHGLVDRGGFVTTLGNQDWRSNSGRGVWEILLGMILVPAVLGLASISHGE